MKPVLRICVDLRVIGAIIILSVVCVIAPYLSNAKTTPSFFNVQPDARYCSVNYAFQSQDVSFEGDLTIENDTTYVIENSVFAINGTITVKDTSSVVIRDSEFTLNSSWEDDAIILMNSSSLLITNSTMIFYHGGGFDSLIDVRDSAQANITDSRFQNWVYILAHGNAAIHMTNSTLTRLEEIDASNPSGILTYDTSSATVEDSIADGVFTWDNSTAFVRNLISGIMRNGWDEKQNVTIQLADSKINEIDMGTSTFSLRIENSTVQRAYFHGANVWVNGTSVQQAYFDGANAWVNGSSVRYAHFNGAVSASFRASSLTEIVAQGESSIQLVDSSYGSIQTEDNATVLVGWQLPIFGVVAMPYAWIPIIQTGAALTILIVSTVLLVFAYRRWKRQQDEKLRKLAESENQSIARLLR